MSWKRRVNETLGGLTGFTVTRVGTSSSAASTKAPEPLSRSKAAVRKPRRSATKAVAVRAPADPAVDRLLTSPIFVISPVRSGSTLLRYLLNAHSQLHAPHELHVRRLSVHFHNKLAENAMEVLGHNQADLEHLLWDRVLHRELVRTGKRFIVDKTPGNVFAHERIATCWPDARFIFLIRHPMSIAQSWAEASPDRRNHDESVQSALKFMRAAERARTALDGITVRYEDLTDEPTRETQRLCAFLDLPWEEGMLDYGRGGGVYTKGLGDWKDKIQSGSVQRGRALPRAEDIPHALQDMCRAWGYLPPSAPTGN